MKSTESVEKYASEVRLYTNYAIKHIKTICKTFGPRPVGSDADIKTQEYLLKELESSCDTATREEFKCADKAPMAWMTFAAIMMIISAVLLTVGIPYASFALSVVTLLVILVGKPIVDAFLPKKASGNLIGVRKAVGEAKRRIILTGSTDSSYEWNYYHHGGKSTASFIIFAVIFSVLLNIGGSVYSIIAGNGFVWFDDNLVMKIIAAVTYVTVPALVAACFFINYKCPVTGANNNLTGALISAGVIKFMQANNLRLENTEIVVLMLGGKEAGSCGAKAWVKAHANEIKSDGIETVVLSLDTIREFDYLTVGTAKSDKAAALVSDAAKNLDYDIPTKSVKYGSEDANAVAKAGLPTAALVAMNPASAEYYRTRLDTEDNLDPKTIEAGLKIALESVYLFDENGIS